LDSYKISYSTANEKITKTNLTISHFNYYCRSIVPKIPKPVRHSSYHNRASPKTKITTIQYTKLKIWIFDSKVTKFKRLNIDKYTGNILPGDQRHLIDILTSNSQKFEASHFT
jgi:hypothetical protein